MDSKISSGPHSEDSRTPVLGAWADLARVAADAGHANFLDPCIPAKERLELGLFRVVVMGEIKKGKSSFVNALLGVDSLLPVDSDIATSTVYKVMYGAERRYKVFFRPDVDTGKRQPPKEIAPEEVSAYGTEGGNPANVKGVDFIGVELPGALLKDGLVLVDTPGVGGLYKAHRDVTWSYAPNADAVFFILDSVEAVISKDEVLFLKELIGKVTRRVYFVQTKTDAADADQTTAWRERNRAVLSAELGIPTERIPYFTVSSKLKAVADRRLSNRHLADSGFPAVLDFLQHRLMREKRRHLANDLAAQLLASCRTLRTELGERQDILHAGQKAELDRVKRDYEQARRDFEDWQRIRWPQDVKTFQRRLADLRQRTRNEIQDHLDPTGPVVASILEPLRGVNFDPRELNERAMSVQQDCLVRASERIGDVYRRFNEEAVRLLAETLPRFAAGLRPQDSVELPTVGDAPLGSEAAIPLRKNLDMHFSGFETARNLMYGGMAGGTMATIGIGLISMLFPPAAAVGTLAAFIGGAIGAEKAEEAAKLRRQEEALSKLSALLHDLLRKAQRQALIQFDDMAVRLEREAEERFHSASEARRNELEARLRQVEEARGRSRDDYQAEAARLTLWTKSLSRIEADLKTRCADEPGRRS